MARKKDMNWNLPDESSWDVAKLAVLMDIRDELKALNAILSCPNFLGIPFTLRDISRNTRKPKRKPKLRKVG